MDVHIGEVHSTVHASDGQELLSPQVLQQIVKVVLERLRMEMEHEHSLKCDRDLHKSVLTHYTEDWR